MRGKIKKLTDMLTAPPTIAHHAANKTKANFELDAFVNSFIIILLFNLKSQNNVSAF